MNPDRWSAVNQIFHAALEVEPGQRQALVLAQSGGDTEVEAEVHLLLRADEQAGTYLDEPVNPAAYTPDQPTPIAPGDILCHRFRIVRSIAEGGMGQVFEAFDTELAVRIALKVIRPAIASNPEAIARFRQEVRLARSITHPNICRTFDLERDTLPSGEVVFLTMEFLAGETLASRIARQGALPLDEALATARQIAAALEAAHALGIIHRDMKPANIMLVPAEHGAGIGSGLRVVTTDFGLARLEPLSLDRIVQQDGHSTFSQTGRPIGTLGYMAPEQLDGAPVSPATDLYAFALILFEMATGKRLFQSANLLSGIAQRLNDPAVTLESKSSHLPIPWRAAIEAGLRRDPASRPQSAAQMMEILEGTRRAPALPTPRRTLLLRWGLAFAAVLLVATVSLFYAGLRFTGWKPDAKVAPGALVYLAEVDNQTGERSLDATTELLRASLAQSAQVNLLDQGRVGDILQQMKQNPETHLTPAIGREIAMRTGAARVVFATLSGSNGNYRLNLDIQQPDNTPARYRTHWPKTFQWSSVPTGANTQIISPELLATVRQAADWVRHETGESAHDIAQLNLPPEDVTTGNWQALTAYADAGKLIDRGDKENGVKLLQEAVQIDPGFARAYADLADNLVSMHRRKEGYAAYAKALNEGMRQRLSRKERDFIKGTFAADTRDYETSLAAFRDYSDFYENDFYGWFYQALPLERLDRPQDAIAPLLRSEALSPIHHGGAGELAYCYMLLGNYAEARRWMEVVKQSGKPEFATYLTGVDEFLEGRYDEAEATFTSLEKSASENFRVHGYGLRARVEAERGQYADAISTIEAGTVALRSVANADRQGMRILDLAYIQCRLGKTAQCRRSVDDSLALNAAPDAILWASAILGETLPRLGSSERSGVIAKLEEMMTLLPAEEGDTVVLYAMTRARLRGEIMLARGDAKRALVFFRQADQLDAPLAPREYLGRGLVAAAAAEPNQELAHDLRVEALSAYGKSALRPATVWLDSKASPPGFLADQMESYLELAAVMKRQDSLVDRVAASLRGLRPSPRSSAPAHHSASL